MFDCRPGQDQCVPAQDVIDIGALLRQHIDARQVAGGAREPFLDRRPVDDQHRIPAERLKPRSQRFGLGLVDMGRVDHDELTLALLRRQRRLEAESAHLLLQVECVAADNRPENSGPAAKLRRPQAALAGAAGALLFIGFFGGPLNFADSLRLVVSGAALRQLPIDDAREDVAADGEPEDLVGEFDVADLLIVEIAYDELHSDASPAGVSAAGVSAGAVWPRTAAGNGNPSGALRLTASLTRT